MALDFESSSRAISHLFWLDDDVLVPRACLLKLLSHQADIASGVYFTKSDIGEPLIFPEPGNGAAFFAPDEILSCYGWSLGLSVVKMDVFKRIIKECNPPLDKYGNPRFFHKPTEADCTFKDGILGVGGTEDFEFFRLCSQIGVKPVIDCTRYAFGWHYDKDSHKAFPTEQWSQYSTGQPVVWKTPKGEVVWHQGA